MKSSQIGEVLILCEMLLNDCDSCHVKLDTEGITLAMNNLEKRLLTFYRLNFCKLLPLFYIYINYFFFQVERSLCYFC
jgi:hypothetical protein